MFGLIVGLVGDDSRPPTKVGKIVFVSGRCDKEIRTRTCSTLCAAVGQPLLRPSISGSRQLGAISTRSDLTAPTTRTESLLAEMEITSQPTIEERIAALSDEVELEQPKDVDAYIGTIPGECRDVVSQRGRHAHSRHHQGVPP